MYICILFRTLVKSVSRNDPKKNTTIDSLAWKNASLASRERIILSRRRRTNGPNKVWMDMQYLKAPTSVNQESFSVVALAPRHLNHPYAWLWFLDDILNETVSSPELWVPSQWVQTLAHQICFSRNDLYNPKCRLQMRLKSPMFSADGSFSYLKLNSENNAQPAVHC